MDKEPTNEIEPEVVAEPVVEKRGLFGRKRKKLTMKEQIREILPLFYFLVIGAIGYGIFYAVTYNWAPKFQLGDQHETVHSIDFTGEKPVIIAFAGRDRDELQNWTIKLMGSYGQRIDSHRIMNLSRLSPGHHHIARGFMTRVPVPILIDYDGEVTKKFRYEGEESALYVISADGVIKERIFGAMTDEKWQLLSSTLDALLTT